MSAEARRRTTLTLLLRFLQRTVAIRSSRNRRPVLIVLENGQWLDDASWELALLANRHVRPMVMVIVTRPLHSASADAPLPPACLNLLDTPGVDFFRLRALPPDAAADLVCQRLGVRSLQPEFQRLLWAKTGGHPVYSEEIVQEWEKQGVIRVDEQVGLLSADPDLLAQAPVPHLVQKAITSRLEHLAPSPQLVLKVASVIGESFTVEELRAVYPIAAEHDKLAGHIETLRQLDFIRQHENAPDTFAFKYSVIREVARDLLLKAQRQELIATPLPCSGKLSGE
jgi:predicted ATPase